MLKSLAAEIFGIEVDPRQGGASLADFEWKYRVLIISPDSGHRQATQQSSLLLATADGLRERDLIVLELGKAEVLTLFGPEHDLNPYAIRYDLDVTDDFFALLLVGKDGSVKLRSEEVVPSEDIFALIDQMPMRKREMPH